MKPPHLPTYCLKMEYSCPFLTVYIVERKGRDTDWRVREIVWNEGDVESYRLQGKMFWDYWKSTHSMVWSSKKVTLVHKHHIKY